MIMARKDEVELTEKNFAETPEEREHEQRLEDVRERFGSQKYQYEPKDAKQPSVYSDFAGKMRQRAQVALKSGIGYVKEKRAEAAEQSAMENRAFKRSFREQKVRNAMQRGRVAGGYVPPAPKAPKGMRRAMRGTPNQPRGFGFNDSDRAILGFDMGGSGGGMGMASRRPMRGTGNTSSGFGFDNTDSAIFGSGGMGSVARQVPKHYKLRKGDFKKRSSGIDLTGII